VVTASGSNPTLTFTAPTGSAATPLTLALCNDTTARTWTLPGTALNVGTPIVLSTCVWTTITYDGTNYHGSGSTDTPSILNFTAERTLPTVVAPGGAITPSSADHNAHFTNGTLVDFAMVKTGADVNNTTGQVTATHLSAGLPRNQGGFGNTSAGTGIVRDGSPPTASELSVDAVTSGSNAVTVKGINGVPLCTGFTPTNGQALQYTTASSPNPCYTAAIAPAYATIDSNGTGVTQRPTVNYISGTNATVACVDNSGSNRTDCTVSASAGSSAPTFPVNAQTATYQLLAADFTSCKTISVASGTFTITAVASGTQPASGTCVWIVNYGSGVVTFARSGQNINGAAANLTIPASSASSPHGLFVVSDATNYVALPLGSLVTSVFGLTGAVGNLTGDVTSSGVATTIAANAVTSAKMAAVNTRRVCDIAIGDTSAASALTNAQLGPQSRVCYIPAAATIIEMDVAADAGTPNIIVGRNAAGTVTNIVSAALATAASGGIACSNTGGTTGLDGVTTCSATLQNTSLSAGYYLGLVSGTAGGTAKWMNVHVVYTIN